MPERNPFTDSEDKFLAEYIAKYNPDPSGRSGNTLYKTLAENPKRWPWSSTHPWASWRERYVRNAESFDRRIKHILKTQKAAKEATKGATSVAGPSNRASTNVVKRKPTAPVTQQNASSTKVTKETGNASTDSGYVSANQKQPNNSRGSKRRSQKTTPTQLPETLNDDTGVASSSKRPLTPIAPPVPASDREDNMQQVEGPVEKEYKNTEHIGENDYVHELFGSFVDDEHDVGLGGSPVSSVPDVTELRPQGDVLDSPTVAGVGSRQHTVHPENHPPKISPSVNQRSTVRIEKRPLKRKASDDDPFIDRTPTPSPPQPDQQFGKRKAPPSLNQGPFRNAFVSTRGAPKKKNAKVWPPRRIQDNEIRSSTEVVISPKIATVTQKTRQQVNAVASSSKVELPTSASQTSGDDGHVVLMSLFERDLERLGEKYGFTLGVVKRAYMEFGTLEKTVIVLQALNRGMQCLQEHVYEDMQRLFDENDEDGGAELEPYPRKLQIRRIGEAAYQRTTGTSVLRSSDENREERISDEREPPLVDTGVKPKVGHKRTATPDEEEIQDRNDVEQPDRMDVDSDIYERTPEVEVNVLKTEHLKLCTETSLGNRELLKTFAEEQDIEQLKRWSREWIKGQLATLDEAAVKLEDIE